MTWMMILVGAQGLLAIAVVLWLHRIRIRLHRAERALAGTVETAAIAEKRLAEAIRIQHRLATRLYRWRAHFKRIAEQETPTANATVRRMARMARELPAGPGVRT